MMSPAFPALHAVGWQMKWGTIFGGAKTYFCIGRYPRSFRGAMFSANRMWVDRLDTVNGIWKYSEARGEW